MKQFAVVVFFLISADLGLAFQNPSEWITYKSVEGRYSILLPVQPTLGTQERSTAAGEKVTQYKATASDGKATFLIGYFDHVPGTTFSFDKARDGIVGTIKGTLLSERAISLGGHRGRELKVSVKGPDGTELLDRARLYDVHKRVYVLQVITVKSEDDSASAEKANRYFDSFQVTKTP